ncbi:MAG: cobyric acid synthase [Firmicutes bacterium]|nr:cobyric acid synthase [Bacillota bacterium]MCL5040598.1 cobyric acid synthase [Bacillota bacterium]
MGKAIMLQGTSSHVGKSILVTALCRVFWQDGFQVAPFKSQNMALNSYVTRDGGEIGRAQGIQALACGLEPTVDMNPILLKPKQDAVAQVIVRGRPLGDMTAWSYRQDYLPQALDIVKTSLARLKAEYDLVVMEGAGSPVEINLKDRDIVNMKAAELAEAPVFLVADIDRGGVFASLIGTMELLEPGERERVAGFIINKFRGDIKLLEPGLDFLERRTGKPVVGVIPHIDDLAIDDEDSVSLEEGGRSHPPEEAELDIAILKLPRISNFTDFDPLEREPKISVRYVERLSQLGEPDAIILPGTKNTVEDLLFLRQKGLAQALADCRQRGKMIIGICGGYQMLGKRLLDPDQAESDRGDLDGMGLLETETVFARDKVVNQVAGEFPLNHFAARPEEVPVAGYEIHMGHTRLLGETRPLLRLTRRGGQRVKEWDGAISPDGMVFGTYLHGIFANDLFRRSFINALRVRKGLAPLTLDGMETDYLNRERAFDRLAQVVRRALHMEIIYASLGLKKP